MNPNHPTWRYIPNQTASVRRERRWVRPVVFWTLSIVFAVGLACVVPFGFLLVLPFMIGFLGTVRERRNEPTQPEYPYDNL